MDRSTIEIIKLIVEDNPIFAKAHKRYKNFTKNDKLVEFYKAHQKWKIYKNLSIACTKKENIEQGIEQEHLVTIRKMLTEGLNIGVISSISGLSISEIEELKKP